MISSTLGAPLGGAMRGGQKGFDWAAVSAILPPKGGLGGGNCLPSIVIIASGAPGTPWITPSAVRVSCAVARETQPSSVPATMILAEILTNDIMIFLPNDS